MKLNSSRFSESVDGEDGRGVADGESMYLPGTGGTVGAGSTTFPGIGGGRGFSKRGVEVGGLGGRGGGRGAESDGLRIGSLGGLVGAVLRVGSIPSESGHLSWGLLCGIEG